MRVLVTGGCGFIGTHLVGQLLGRGDEVRVLDCLLPSAHAPEAPPQVDPRADLIIGDVRDPAAASRSLAGMDAVCHLAGMVGLESELAEAPDYVSCNDEGTAVLLAAMADQGIGHLVLASSMVVYGEGAYRCPEHGPVAPGPRLEAALAAGDFEPSCPICSSPVQPLLVEEGARLDPRSIYATTKVSQEHLSASWARLTGGRAIALRYHNVYGPWMPRDSAYCGVAALFRSALERGAAPEVFEDGGQRRDFVHVDDVAAATVRALDPAVTGAGFRAYNIGSGRPHTVGQLAAALAAGFGGPDPVISGRYRLGDVRHLTASSERAITELGYRPGTAFTAGVKEFARAPLRPSLRSPVGPPLGPPLRR